MAHADVCGSVREPILQTASAHNSQRPTARVRACELLIRENKRNVLEGKRVGTGQLDVSVLLIEDDRSNTLRWASNIQGDSHTHTPRALPHTEANTLLHLLQCQIGSDRQLMV